MLQEGTAGTIDRVARPERALVLLPVLNKAARSRQPEQRSAQARLDEGVGLARAIDLEVVDALIAPLGALRPATLVGTGKVEEIARKVEDEKIGLVVVDHALTPVQQRNLEKAWKTKVIDRTALILEIFGERAQTKEGVLQVELAHLNYQKGRLVRSWTHLERQRGGFGFLGGPGETQIEADRRMIETRIKRIEKDLESVVSTRDLQRQNRRRQGTPVVALVGYTNAGKSTLFNRLTHADTRAEDMLFATLDPTLRKIELPEGTEAILSDTVGFISELPTHLVAAFRATLEEVVQADLILHVRDIAHPDTAAQARDVEAVLRQLGLAPEESGRFIEVWNKVDLLPPGERKNGTGNGGPPASGIQTIAVSALTGEGIDALLVAIEARVTPDHEDYRVTLSGAELGKLHRLYELGEVMERSDLESGDIAAVARVPRAAVNRFLSLFPHATGTKRD